MRIQAPRGTEDVVPAKAARWQEIESAYHHIASLYGYREIRTPVFEDVQLFKRTAGETSDIVDKEMYEFQDKGGRDIALKPEGTAPAIRAVLEHNLCPTGTHLRLWYATACYRYGRPGAGRLRELHQLGAELLGSSSADADAEVIELAMRFFESLGIQDVPVKINSIGRDGCRVKFREVILNHVKTYLKDADEVTRGKIEKNPLGMLDSKDPKQKEALQGLPSILEFLEDDSKQRFDQLRALLAEAKVPYLVSPEIVRGLDYYTETVFEYEHPALPGLSVYGGGRYDNLVTQLGGQATPCVGYGIGMERLLAVLERLEHETKQAAPLAFIVQAAENAGHVARAIARDVRAKNLRISLDLDRRSLKSQMRQADGSGATFAIIIGEDELAQSKVSVKNLKTSDQQLVAFDKVVEFLCEHSSL
jgi:histidyl-tRNA synthetase